MRRKWLAQMIWEQTTLPALSKTKKNKKSHPGVPKANENKITESHLNYSKNYRRPFVLIWADRWTTDISILVSVSETCP